MSKSLRQESILKLLSSGRVPSQLVLVSELKRIGYDVTQATVCRDLAELNVVKSKNGYIVPGTIGAPPPFTSFPGNARLFRDSVISVDSAQNMVVVRTRPGCARQVAVVLDSNPNDRMLGTVAGDDTIFVTMRSSEDALTLRSEITEQLHQIR